MKAAAWAASRARSHAIRSPTVLTPSGIATLSSDLPVRSRNQAKYRIRSLATAAAYLGVGTVEMAPLGEINVLVPLPFGTRIAPLPASFMVVTPVVGTLPP